MSRFVLLDMGDELGPATEHVLRTAAAPVLVRLLNPPPPFRETQILHVHPRHDARVGGRAILLARVGDGYQLQAPTAPNADVLGRVVAIERGPVVVRLDRGLLSRLPVPWVIRAVE